MFKLDDIVEIVKPDKVPSEEEEIYNLWAGYRAKVIRADSVNFIEGSHFTKLEPIGPRPDEHEPGVNPGAWFYWDTDELRRVSPE